MGARDKLVASAIDLMRRHGIAGTGIAQLLEASGVSRRSVYLSFPGGKAELVAEATRVAGEAYSALMRTVTAGADVATCVAAYPAMWRETMLASNFTAGCPIVHAALSRAEAPAAADAAQRTFAEWEEILAERLRAEQVDPDTARSLATTIIAAVEGAVVLSLAERSEAPLERTAKHLAELIAQHTRQTTIDLSGYVAP
ncbi:TetR/AcrR family transcriptional regulator [Nocardia sp. NPDC051832]|uniref:TetR/AcrR family transcriptional regulator n=1 Tax=Nocardia sp. NPDC051832 TaxID=3155673 RepID=UPI003419A498